MVQRTGGRHIRTRNGTRTRIVAAALCVVTVALAAGATSAVAAGGPAAGGGPGPFGAADPASRSEGPDLLDSPRRGTAATEGLGANLPEVARRNGLSVAELHTALKDPTVWLDRGGRVHFVEPPAPDAALTATGSTDTFSTLTEAETFTLHSKPGAQRTVFLDFDGTVVSGTAWNANYSGGLAFTAEPYDTDSSPATFSAGEKAVIRSVWQRVAEDFAPFDVDVTTQAPDEAAITRSSSTDAVYGTRLLVTNTNTIYGSCGCGGIAYLGVFGLAGANHSYYQPAFVFQRGVGGGAKNIAEAASHEIGHNLGLRHDGTATAGYYQGHGSWAPIMGVGYYRAISQWSRGEYAGANNTEDDFSVMVNNGAPLRADDHADTQAAATALAGGSLNATGRIGGRTDKDVLSFQTAGGAATITVGPAPVSPDLDVRLSLLNASGAVVATADPTSGSSGADAASGLAATIATTLAAGTYYVEIDGVGFGDPASSGYSDYGSLGEYRLTGSVVASTNQPPTATINATPTSGTGPLTVNFTSTGSSDPEGAALTFAWNFGDGTTATGPTAGHTYQNAGAYTATLTVTDSAGASASASTVITVNVAVVQRAVGVSKLTGEMLSRSRNRFQARVVATVSDASNLVVSGATVTGTWSGGVTGTATGITGANGTVTFTSPLRSGRSDITFTVSNVSGTNLVYSGSVSPITVK
ncbi:MAG: PKD domain-containing protein [Acidimicrobiales bacterium]